MDRPQPVENRFGVFRAGDPSRDTDPPTDVYEVFREHGGKKETAGWIRYTKFEGLINCQITAYLSDDEIIDRLYEKLEDGHFGYWQGEESLPEDIKLKLKLTLMSGIYAALEATGSDEEKRYSTALYGEPGDTDGLQKAIEWIAKRYEIAG